MKAMINDRRHLHIPFGEAPRQCGEVAANLNEFMYYLYLPVMMDGSELRLPPNVESSRPIIQRAMESSLEIANPSHYRYIYLSARKGFATKDNPLNRPGWHCDGFGTTDLNYVWWKGPGTRFALQKFKYISEDHKESLRQFEEQVRPGSIVTYPESHLYEITPTVVHATPVIEEPCIRQYVKISFSDHQYNLENNSHNYLFDYNWPLNSREVVRNDTFAAQRDYA